MFLIDWVIIRLININHKKNLYFEQFCLNYFSYLKGFFNVKTVAIVNITYWCSYLLNDILHNLLKPIYKKFILKSINSGFHLINFYLNFNVKKC